MYDSSSIYSLEYNLGIVYSEENTGGCKGTLEWAPELM